MPGYKDYTSSCATYLDGLRDDWKRIGQIINNSSTLYHLQNTTILYKIHTCKNIGKYINDFNDRMYYTACTRVHAVHVVITHQCLRKLHLVGLYKLGFHAQQH